MRMWSDSAISRTRTGTGRFQKNAIAQIKNKMPPSNYCQLSHHVKVHRVDDFCNSIVWYLTNSKFPLQPGCFAQKARLIPVTSLGLISTAPRLIFAPLIPLGRELPHRKKGLEGICRSSRAANSLNEIGFSKNQDKERFSSKNFGWGFPRIYILVMGNGYVELWLR
jgi:hypothetical protein